MPLPMTKNLLGHLQMIRSADFFAPSVMQFLLEGKNVRLHNSAFCAAAVDIVGAHTLIHTDAHIKTVLIYHRWASSLELEGGHKKIC